MTDGDGYARLHGTLRALPRAALEQAAPDAARALLGALIVREVDGTQVLARIVETEAYHQDDPASHSHIGRTARTEPMFWRAGTSYVYRSYGVHWCFNVSAEEEGIGAAVLVRAAAVVTGHEVVRARRSTAARDVELLRGPGRLTSGLDIDRVRHDRVDVVEGGAGLYLATDGWTAQRSQIRVGPRVGVSRAADLAWRYHLADRREVSPYRRSPRALAAPETTRERRGADTRFDSG